MEKKHFRKTGISYSVLTYGLFTVTVIFISYSICSRSNTLNNIAICVPIALAAVVIFLVIDLITGRFDKISFNEKGITTYRLYKKRFYPWDKVINTDLKTDFFREQHIITFTISYGKKKPYELVISDYGEIIDDIKQYYSLDETESKRRLM